LPISDVESGVAGVIGRDQEALRRPLPVWNLAEGAGAPGTPIESPESSDRVKPGRIGASSSSSAVGSGTAPIFVSPGSAGRARLSSTAGFLYHAQPPLMRGGAVWQLVGLITRRSQVQILPPLPMHLPR